MKKWAIKMWYGVLIAAAFVAFLFIAFCFIQIIWYMQMNGWSE